MVWQPYLSILISVEGIREQHRLHLNTFAPVIRVEYCRGRGRELCVSHDLFRTAKMR